MLGALSMSDDLYIALLDDSQELLGIVEKKLHKAKEMLMASGHPGIRLANRQAADLIFKLMDISRDIDLLPESIIPPTKNTKEHICLQ
jgi:hypothetical protein